MADRHAEAVWKGNLKNGHGKLSAESRALRGGYSFSSRFQDGDGTNPEELVAAAHAGCFSMALSHGLTEAGHAPEQINTTATVHLESKDGGFHIPRIELKSRARVPGINAEDFQRHAQTTKEECPISKLVQGAEIVLDAKLESSET